jgi:methylmalonyl-CoA mutase N-terminal domain/subunit
VTEALYAVRQAAGGTENIMPHILHAVEKNGTLGEISDVLREVFGEFRG